MRGDEEYSFDKATRKVYRNKWGQRPIVSNIGESK